MGKLAKKIGHRNLHHVRIMLTINGGHVENHGVCGLSAKIALCCKNATGLVKIKAMFLIAGNYSVADHIS